MRVCKPYLDIYMLSKPPARIQAILTKVKLKKDIDAVALLDLPSLEYRAILKMLKSKNYIMDSGHNFFIFNRDAEKTHLL